MPASLFLAYDSHERHGHIASFPGIDDDDGGGLPVKAGERIGAGTMVAWDHVLALACSASPAMPATAIVVGRCQNPCGIDNLAGNDGDMRVQAKQGVFSWANDGTVTVNHLLQPVYVIDDHTVGAVGSHLAGIVFGFSKDLATVMVDTRLNTTTNL